jgi:hypothetical protein
MQDYTVWHNYNQSKCGTWPPRQTLGLGHVVPNLHGTYIYHVAPRLALGLGLVAPKLNHMAFYAT